MKNITFIIVALLLFRITCIAALEGIGMGARSTGLAEAFVAVADDASALTHNPAGLTQRQEISFTAHHARFLENLSNAANVGANDVGFAHPLKKGQAGTIALGYSNFKAANFFTDQTIRVGYGWRLPERIFGSMGRWSAGVALKHFERRYEPDQYSHNAINGSGIGSGEADPLFSKNGYSKRLLSVDVGTLYQFGDQNSFGLSVANVNQPDFSLEKEGDRAPLVIRAGMARRFPWGLLSAELRRIKRLSSQMDSEAAVGGERQFPISHLGSFDLRAGYAQGSRGFRNATAGMSIAMASIRLDYAFQFPLGDLSDAGGNHYVTFSFYLPSAGKSRMLASHSMTEQLTHPKTNSTFKASAADTVDPYTQSVQHYLTRKADGAPITEQLNLLQNLYLKYGDTKVDMAWMAEELIHLGQPK